MRFLSLAVLVSFLPALGCNRVTVLHSEADAVADAPAEDAPPQAATNDACETQEAVGAFEAIGGVLLAVASLSSKHHSGHALRHAAGLFADGAARASACAP